ncbi:hypothetical protein V6Z11_A05G289900 [Gossypium hirsutum]
MCSNCCPFKTSCFPAIFRLLNKDKKWIKIILGCTKVG